MKILKGMRIGADLSAKRSDYKIAKSKNPIKHKCHVWKVVCKDRRKYVIWSSYKEHKVDALALGAEEGRSDLRKATGSRKQAPIRGCPNGETRQSNTLSPLTEYIG
jgi:hypothetical protein